jgi:hypothetical protein
VAVCTFRVAGTYSVRVSVTDSNNFTSALSGAATVVILPSPSVTPPISSVPSADVGQTVTFSTSAAGGSGAYPTFTWRNLSFGRCTGIDSAQVTCMADATGTFAISVGVVDTLGGISAESSPLLFTVYPALGVDPVALAPSILYVNTSASLSATVTGGAPGTPTFDWTGLPPRCSATSRPALECVPTSEGQFSVSVIVNDSNGAVAVSPPVTLSVVAYPTLAYFLATPPNVTLGAPLGLSVLMRGGEEPFSYTYTGLPPGCLSLDAATLECVPRASGTYAIQVNATDALGTTVRGFVVVHVRAVVSGGLLDGGGGLLLAGIVGAVAAGAVSVGIIYGTQRGRPSGRTRAESSHASAFPGEENTRLPGGTSPGRHSAETTER